MPNTYHASDFRRAQRRTNVRYCQYRLSSQSPGQAKNGSLDLDPYTLLIVCIPVSINIHIRVHRASTCHHDLTSYGPNLPQFTPIERIGLPGKHRSRSPATRPHSIITPTVFHPKPASAFSLGQPCSAIPLP
jgi:hypothetical protein